MAVRYRLVLSFTADRTLTRGELADLSNACAVQVEEPHVGGVDGFSEPATFSTAAVEVGAEVLP